MLGLCCAAQASHAVASSVAEHRQSTGSVGVTRWLSCCVACGIFPDQGSNPCLLHWPGGLFTTHPHRLSFPSPGDLPNPGFEPVSLASPTLAGGFFIS